MRLHGFKACMRASRRAKKALAHSLRVRLVAMFVLPFAVVYWMNWKAARAMQRKIDEIDAGAA